MTEFSPWYYVVSVNGRTVFTFKKILEVNLNHVVLAEYPVLVKEYPTFWEFEPIIDTIPHRAAARVVGGKLILEGTDQEMIPIPSDQRVFAKIAKV